jgi:hypothetical protein
MHVKMTRIESGVTIPKGLFTLYVNVKIVTAKIFWPPSILNTNNRIIFYFDPISNHHRVDKDGKQS